MEAYVIKCDITCKLVHFDSICVFHFPLGMHNFVETSITSHTALNTFKNCRQCSNWRNDVGNVQNKRCKLTIVNLFVEEKHTACKQCHKVQQVGKQPHTAVEDTHLLVCLSASVLEVFVGFVKLVDFVLGCCVCLGNTDSANGAFHLCVYFPRLLTHFGKGLLLTTALNKCKPHHKGHKGKCD